MLSRTAFLTKLGKYRRELDMAHRFFTLLTLAASLTILGLAAAGSPAAFAETIGISRQGSPETGPERPRTGQTKEVVEARFGTALAVRGPVGDPPITIWDYPGYTVYFEYNHVIHTVLKPAQ